MNYYKKFMAKLRHSENDSVLIIDPGAWKAVIKGNATEISYTKYEENLTCAYRDMSNKRALRP